MVEAEHIKTIPVTLPNDTVIYIDVYVDPRTDLLFALDASFVEQMCGTAVITSPYNQHAKLSITT